MGYRNEAAFSRAFTEALRRRKWFIQRIESGTTGKGIPDIYAISPFHWQSMWFELKREHTLFVTSGPNIVHWRPGQQAWMHEVSKYGIPCQTVVAFDNAVVVVPHWEVPYFKGNVIDFTRHMLLVEPTVSAMADRLTKITKGGRSYDKNNNCNDSRRAEG